MSNKKRSKALANKTDDDAGTTGRVLTKKQLKRKVDSITAFRITFTGTPQTRTISVSSTDLQTALKKEEEKLDPDEQKHIMRRVDLGTIRVCGKLPNSYLFCVNDTNTVPDTTLLCQYVLMIEDNIIPLSGDVSTDPILIVRYTSRHRRPDKIPPPPTLPSAGKDDSTAAKVDNKIPEGVNIDTAGLAAESGDIVSTHPAELTEQQWNYVMVTNSLLHGMFFDKTSFSLQKAREPAFKLKESVPDRFYRPASAKRKVESDTDENDATEHFHIPAFEVNDKSFVNITEVKTTLQHSMAQQGFSSWSAELSASGGVGTYSGGVSVSGSSTSSTSSASNEGEATDCLHASYNFPRVKVFLDADDLEISDDCKELLQAIETNKKPEDVTKFYRKFGHIFSSSVQLGGRLHATKESDTTTKDKAKAAKSELKAAAGASFSASFASGSASVAYANSKGSQSGDKDDKSSESLSWEAQGGETLLGSNPAAWITTVGSFYNWRVIERSNTNSILALMRDVSKQDWPAIFSSVETVLVKIGSPPQPGVIQIKNNGSSWVLVAVSNATYAAESPKFFVLHPGKSNVWKRSDKELVFINGGGSGRVAVAVAEPNSYIIQELDYVDPNVDYVPKADLVNQISITNNLATTIQVKITTNSGLGVSNFVGVPNFFDVAPGNTEKWTRSELETIFVKHPASMALFTYLGISGQDLQINGVSDSSAPKSNTTRGTVTANQIGIDNGLGKKIFFMITNVQNRTGPSGNFYPVGAGAVVTPWTRTEANAEAAYVNVDGTTTAWAYYVDPPCTFSIS